LKHAIFLNLYYIKGSDCHVAAAPSSSQILMA